MRQEERFSLILHELADSGSVSIADLAPRLGVSKASVRRDLELLEERHLLTRTHGGAAAAGLLLDLPLRYGAGTHRAVKRRIAAAAIERVTRRRHGGRLHRRHDHHRGRPRPGRHGRA